jgi:hypothetical protein
VDERHARRAQVEVDLEGPRSLGWEVTFEVVDEQVDTFLALRHVRG